MYRSTPKILRFQPIHSFIFPLHEKEHFSGFKNINLFLTINQSKQQLVKKIKAIFIPYNKSLIKIRLMPEKQKVISEKSQKWPRNRNFRNL